MGEAQVRVGGLSRAYGRVINVGSSSVAAGDTTTGNAVERQGELIVGQPVSRLLGYKVIRQHKRVVPIQVNRQLITPFVRTKVQTQPIYTRTFVRQPLTVASSHKVASASNEELARAALAATGQGASLIGGSGLSGLGLGGLLSGGGLGGGSISGGISGIGLGGTDANILGSGTIIGTGSAGTLTNGCEGADCTSSYGA